MQRNFRIWSPLSFFEKSGVPAGQRRRIAGIVSTEIQDKQQEVVVQKGLDFAPWLQSGYYNDNHSKKTTDILGYPTSVSKFQKGQRLPNGKIAKANGTWAEGYLLDTPEADKVWELGKALEKAGEERRLGYSIEGSVQRRAGPGGKRIVKAVVRNVAITNCPVGEGTGMETLTKSLTEAQQHIDDEGFWKAMTAGAASPGEHVSNIGPATGDKAAQVVSPQSLEQKGQKRLLEDDEDEEISKGDAIAIIKSRYPGATYEFCERAYNALFTMKQRGLL